MGLTSNKFGITPKKLAILSLASGISSIAVIFNPPIELLLGACAVLLAWLFRIYNQKFSLLSIIGLVLGIIGILLSIFVFLNYIAVIRLMDNPESLIQSIKDPDLANQFREMLNYYREMLNNLK
ncbi:MAG: hypothetical protein LUD07_12970 [Clostridiales bacterium]|nr:hypothetical protein [Clostridiales bacterium]